MYVCVFDLPVYVCVFDDTAGFCLRLAGVNYSFHFGHLELGATFKTCRRININVLMLQSFKDHISALAKGAPVPAKTPAKLPRNMKKGAGKVTNIHHEH